MTTLEDRRSAILDEVAARLGPDSKATPEFVEAYYRHVLTEDLAQLNPEDLAGGVLSHLSLASTRQAEETLIDVFTPRIETHGWAPGATVIEVVTDDMPFIVDSITTGLAQAGEEVRLLVHPQLSVERDETGAFTGIGQDGRQESWVHVEIAQVPDQASAEQLRDRIEQILQDVAAVVADWQPMVEKAQEISDSVDSGPAVVSEDERGQVRQLIDWLIGDHFIFMGYRGYRLHHDEQGAVLEQVQDSGLGLMRNSQGTVRRVLEGAQSAKASEPELLIITKANSRSTVHRDAYLDYVGIKIFDDQGVVVGEHRFIGLFTSSVYHSSVETIPVVAGKVQQVLDRSGYDRHSHAGKRLVDVLERLPRDELFQSDVNHLADIATRVVASRFHRQTLLFVRPDVYGRYTSCVVILPRERYDSQLRRRIQQILVTAFAGDEVEFTARVGESTAAMVHYIIRRPGDEPAPAVDLAVVQDWLRAAVRTWRGEWRSAMIAEFGEIDAARMTGRWESGLDEAYRALHSPRMAAFDVRQLEQLAPDALRATVNQELNAQPGQRRLRLYGDRPIALTEVLPKLLAFGLRVIDERTYKITASDGAVRFILDFGVEAEDEAYWATGDDVEQGFLPAFQAVWEGRADSDSLNQLVGAGLGWTQIVALRMVAAYLQQTTPYSRDYLESALVDNPLIATQLAELFEVRFGLNGDADRADREQAAADAILSALADVPSLDHDRMIREFVDVIRAAVRTNFYQDGADPTDPIPLTLALKIDPSQIPHLPQPRPLIETWVYSPRLEGVHLRFGLIARGGLRWSDRRDDFRTEVLGLVKAQSVKNAVIVPAGAKGGFYAKQLPDPQRDRAAWLAAGRQAYEEFVGALLSVTDNLVNGAIVHPDRVVRHDGEDSYLVVAADKGTASFSDLANEVSDSHGFWLSDAFASGGSTGYDHKGMGITARGAWESVKRHFLELGVDPQTTDFTAVGVGDMSGDVFGNGMLRSEHTRLAAAFDHRHVFIDPNPDPAKSFAERERLFGLPYSSWADYDPALISAGGGVFPRTAKSIPVTPEMREVLGMDDVAEVTPTELIRAVLMAPVDLLWNGGIGTYIKAASEQHAEIGDRANDSVRVNGGELRCRVVGEGGNLGVSQLGRIEAAQAGVRINTDAIDNSGGVDSSDQEVNIKILLGTMVADGTLTLRQRNELLKSMTDEVAHQVLRTNYEQNVLLSNARHLKGSMLSSHERLMVWLENHAGLDRELEALPSSDEIAERNANGRGLTSPEFSVLVAYTKMALKNALLESDLPDDEWFATEMAEYFPEPLRGFSEALANHPLRREIIATRVANAVVNRGGITFIHRAVEDSGASLAEVTKAFVIAREVFDLGEFVSAVEQLDGRVPAQTQAELYLEFRRLLDRVVRYILGRGTQISSVGKEIERYQLVVRELRKETAQLYGPTGLAAFEKRTQHYLDQGAGQQLAEQAASVLDGVAFLGVVDMAERLAIPTSDAASGYLHLAEQVRLSDLMDLLGAIPSEGRWDAVAKSTLRQDLYRLVLTLTETALAEGDGQDPADRVENWMAQRSKILSGVREQLDALRDEPAAGLGQFLVIQRELERISRAG